jgi:hypothetical protein
MQTRLTFGLAAFAAAGLTFGATSANAAPTIYEGFNYSTGDIDGTQNGGTGLTGAWTTSGGNQANQFDVVSGLSFSGLSTQGGAVARPDAPGGAEMHRSLSSTAQSALTGDNTTRWFSALMNNKAFAGRFANLALILGTGAVTNDAGDEPVQISGGEGIGVTFEGDDGNNAIDIHGYTSDDGTTSVSSGFIADPNGGGDTSGVTKMIAGKIEWAPNGNNDTLSLYEITDPNAGVPATPFATMTADLDQSQFDTLAIGTQQIGTLDEIRYGETSADVGVVPEPASLALMGLGGLMLLPRRKRA